MQHRASCFITCGYCEFPSVFVLMALKYVRITSTKIKTTSNFGSFFFLMVFHYSARGFWFYLKSLSARKNLALGQTLDMHLKDFKSSTKSTLCVQCDLWRTNVTKWWIVSQKVPNSTHYLWVLSSVMNEIKSYLRKWLTSCLWLNQISHFLRNFSPDSWSSQCSSRRVQKGRALRNIQT